MKVRTKAVVASATLIMATLGMSAASASALTITIVTPNDGIVVLPSNANEGAVNAYTQVLTKGPGPLPLDLVFGP